MNTSPTHTPGQRAAQLGVLTALALVAGYLEMLLPVPTTVPGIKLGLGNIVVLFAIERLGARPALALMLAKVSCSAVLFGNPQVLAFSLAGGLLSWATMSAAARSGWFSLVAVSVIGGISHNAGQLLMVAALLSPAVAIANAPLLLAAGVVCGAVIGVAARGVLRSIAPEGDGRDVAGPADRPRAASPSDAQPARSGTSTDPAFQSKDSPDA